MQFQFNHILINEGIDLKDVLVFRHVPKENELEKALPWIADEKPEIFNAWQQTQKPRAEKAMLKAKYVASFIGHEPGKALFVGLYEVNGYKQLTYDLYWKEPLIIELHDKYGMEGMTNRESKCLWFNLVPLKFYSKWKGKLIISWPGIERSWFRWAERNEFEIHAITEDSILISEMPEWDKLILKWNELEQLPTKWHDRLSQWRGIYYILDVSDGKGYIGSAYGKDNLYGRWCNYAKLGHGGNKELKKRNQENFRFSILELLSPAAETEYVQSKENTWKDRLHTREYGLNDN